MPLIAAPAAPARAASDPLQGRPWHTLSIEEAARTLAVDPARGLEPAEAAARLASYGPNELVERASRSPFAILWEQLTNPLVIILIAAALVSGFLGKWDSTIAIMVIVVLNAGLGFSQEYRAEQAMAALRKMSAPAVRVRRAGRVLDIPAQEVVPGDIVLLEAGSVLPADARVLESASLRVQEAALTGESLPVEKNGEPLFNEQMPLGDRHNMLYMGTAVTYGRGLALVAETGMHTELGRIADLIQGVQQEKTPLQRRMDELGRALFGLAIGIIVLAFALGFLGPNPRLSDMFIAAVAIAVAVVPEGLPAVVTIALALGAQRMLKRQALIRKLPAVETLGSVTVICSDKTGTLTENRMTVKVLDVAGRSWDVIETVRQGHLTIGRAETEPAPETPAQALLLAGGALVTDALLEEGETPGEFIAIGDPTEAAMVVAAARYGLWKSELDRAYPRVGEAPFDSDRKRMSTIHRVGENLPDNPAGEDHIDLAHLLRDELKVGEYLVFSKGAVDSILDVCDEIWADGRVYPLDDQWRARIMAANNELAANGLRVLGVAYRPLDALPEKPESAEEKLNFIGMVGMIDPPRVEVRDAVAVAKLAGIRPIMITGDHPLTAQYIARDLGFSETGEVLTGQDLAAMDEAALAEAVKSVSVFARVSPENKLQIVDALQQQGQIAAMTGDGVNDAPALRRADIGVAMGITGTAVSKEASDMVLLDDNFATIVRAVEEGRTIYENVRKFIKYILASNTGEVFVLLGTQAAGLPLPLTTLQILYMNLVTDGLPALALAVEAGEKRNMQRPPHDPAESIFARGMWQHLVFVGVLIFASGFALSYFGFPRLDFETWSTMVFSTLVLAQMWHALTVRSDTAPVWQGFFENPALLASVFGTVALQGLLIYLPWFNRFFGTTPLSVTELAVCLGLSAIVLVGIEIRKAVLRARGYRSVTGA